MNREVALLNEIKNMKTFAARSWVTFIAAGSLFLGASLSLQAKTISFPEKDPAFTFNLPDSWTTETGPDGRLYCTAPDGFKFGIVVSPSVKNAEDAKALVPTILKAMSDAMKCENYKMLDGHTGQVGKIWMSSYEATGKVEGTEMSMNAVVFSLTPGKYFSIVGAAPRDLNKAHDKDMNDVISSMTPIE
jgi:hypothetical protein